MFLKKKQRVEVNIKGCAEGNIKGCAEGPYHRIFNHKVEPSSHLLPSCSLMGSCMVNTMECNYKLKNVNG